MATKEFVRTWTTGTGGWFSPGFYRDENAARLYFWNLHQYSLQTGLQEEYNAGWKPFTDIGPSALKLRESSKTERAFGVVEVIFWLLSFGLIFLLQLLAGSLTNTRFYYEPIEYRVGLTK